MRSRITRPAMTIYRYRPAPMTAAEARENVEAFRLETPMGVTMKMLRLALRPYSNVTDEAREVYRAELRRIEAIATV